MGTEKVRLILKAHKRKSLQLVNDSLEKGWKTWLAQAAKLQLLRADKDNQKAHGSGFFKMSEEAIMVVQDDLAHDLNELAGSHREEITQLMEEFDAHDIDTSLKLDSYERDRRQQTIALGPPPTSQPQPPHNEGNEENRDEEDDNNDSDNEQRQGAKPSLYDIL